MSKILHRVMNSSGFHLFWGIWRMFICGSALSCFPLNLFSSSLLSTTLSLSTLPSKYILSLFTSFHLSCYHSSLNIITFYLDQQNRHLTPCFHLAPPTVTSPHDSHRDLITRIRSCHSPFKASYGFPL